MILTDSILISGLTGRSISLLSSKSSVVFKILLCLLDCTLLSETSISSIWLSSFFSGAGFTDSGWVTGFGWAKLVALCPGLDSGTGLRELVGNVSEIGGLFIVFPFDASQSASFALKKNTRIIYSTKM